MVKEKLSPTQSTKENISDIKELILYNDNFNTFDFVIKTLIEICDHTPHQAEQCTLIVHNNGKCAVKSGLYNKLKPIHNDMINRNLTVLIE
ncbi:MAG: ATP-dependent Clp protease adaptor ClpS [Bacteroidales bacterium]|nr:ATP-dependent Clp protease adaptor ClpS [Bacteroidales bacterium]